MKSFKLKNKEEEQKIIDKQKKETEINAQNEKLNIIQKNPLTFGAIILGLITLCIIIFFKTVVLLAIILIIFAAGRLLRAKKIGENKKFILVGSIIVYLPVLILIIGSFLFVYHTIKMYGFNNNYVDQFVGTSTVIKNVVSSPTQQKIQENECLKNKNSILSQNNFDMQEIFYSPKLNSCLFAYFDYAVSTDDNHYTTHHIIKNLNSNKIIFDQTDAIDWEEKLKELKSK